MIDSVLLKKYIYLLQILSLITKYWLYKILYCIAPTVLYGKSLLVISFGVYMLILNPLIYPSFPPPTFPFGSHEFVFYVCGSLFCK